MTGLEKLPALAAAVALCTGLAGCADKTDPLCPGAAALVEAASLTGFAPGVRPDPSQALYKVSITDVTTDCSIDAHDRTADSSVTIQFRATRAPTGAAQSYRVPYFVSVRTGPDIQAKKIFWANVSFAPGQSSLSFSQHIDSTLIHIAKDKQPYEYQVLVGLQLTRAQLEYNRKTGQYGP